MAQFDKVYQASLRDIMANGYLHYDKLHDIRIKAMPGLTLETDLSKDGFPALNLRKIPLKLFIAEQIWFLMGEKNPNIFLGDFTKIWHDFVEEDGMIASAYGNRWRNHFKRDQIGDMIKLLQKNPQSRHAVVMAWDPADDGLGSGTVKKNVPCPFTFTVNILGDKLHMHSIIRSNDMILGNPHDTAGFALLAMMLSQKLGIQPGKFTTSISNAHIYENHFNEATELISRNTDQPSIHFELPANSFDRAEQGDKTLVEEIYNLINAQYKPSEALGKMKISKYENLDAMKI